MLVVPCAFLCAAAVIGCGGDQGAAPPSPPPPAATTPVVQVVNATPKSEVVAPAPSATAVPSPSGAATAQSSAKKELPPVAVENYGAPMKGITEYGAKRGTFQMPNDPKAIEKIVENMNWHLENFWSQHQRAPKDINELKAWDFPMHLPGWPIPPAGKNWAFDPTGGRIFLQ